MAPPTWATPRQTEFLNSRRKDFARAQDATIPEFTQSNFRDQLYRDFFAEWPTQEAEVTERAAIPAKKGKLLPAPPLCSNNEEWVVNRKKKLTIWFANHPLGQRIWVGGKPKVSISMNPTTVRIKSETQIYANLYYADRVKDTIDFDRLKSEKKSCLAGINQVIAEAYVNESDSVKEEVQRIRAIDSLPEMIREFLSKMEIYTGWSFTVLAGGPDPDDHGNITSIGVHSCENMYGKSFGKAHPSFKDTFLVPFSSFLDQVYSKEVWDKRTLTSSTSGSGSSDTPNPPSSTPSTPSPVAATVLDSTPPQEFSRDADARDVNTLANSAPKDKMALTNDDIAEPLPLMADYPGEPTASTEPIAVPIIAPPIHTFAPPAPTFMPPIPTFAPPAPAPAFTQPIPTIGQSVVQPGPVVTQPVHTFAQPVAHADTFAQPFPAVGQAVVQPGPIITQPVHTFTPPVAHADTFAQPFPAIGQAVVQPGPIVTQHVHTFAQPVAQSAPTFTFPLPDHSSQPQGLERVGQTNDPFGFASTKPQETYELTEEQMRLVNEATTQWMKESGEFQQGGTSPPFNFRSLWGADPSPESAFNPDQTNFDVPGHSQLPPKLPEHASPSSSLMNNVMTDIGNQLQPQSPLSNLPYLPQPPPTQSSLPGPSQMSSNDENNLEVAVAKKGHTQRQRKATSKEAPVPLTNSKDMVNKWLDEAHVYLSSSNLVDVGNIEAWKKCLEDWMKFEKQDGAVNTTSMRLPGSSERPQELAKWLLSRKYTTLPSIGDVPDFANRWLLWWNSIQPQWRHTAEVNQLPLSLSVSSGTKQNILSLKKTGPSGIIIVLISLKWWSSLHMVDKHWEKAVDDVGDCIKSFLAGAGDNKRKAGECGGDDESKSNKLKTKKS